MKHSDTAVVVTTFCGEPDIELKKHMTKTLVKSLKERDLFVCLAAHSIVSEEIQQYCDVVIYDKDNSFQVNGQPQVNPNHGVAEFTSIHNAINSLERFGFKNIFKLSYDCNPTVDYDYIIEKSKSHDRHLVTGRWHYAYDTAGSLGFFCDIDFYRNILPIERTTPRLNMAMEDVLFHILRERNLFEYVHLYENYETYFENDHVQFCHHGGKVVENYTF
jgi:hypothetical protein